MSCLPNHLLCHSLPAQLRAKEDQGTILPTLGTKSPMAMSKSKPSYKMEFMLDFSENSWVNVTFVSVAVMK